MIETNSLCVETHSGKGDTGGRRQMLKWPARISIVSCLNGRWSGGAHIALDIGLDPGLKPAGMTIIAIHPGRTDCHPGTLLGRGLFFAIRGRPLLHQLHRYVYPNNGFVPPNASTAVPVMAELASDARKTATSAISSGNMSLGLSGRPRVSNASR